MSHARGFFGAALLAGAAALLSGGCAKAEDSVKVQKDGSGSYVEDVALDAAAAARFHERMYKIRAAFRPGFPGAPPGGEPPATGMDSDKPAEPAKPEDPLVRTKERLKESRLDATRDNTGPTGGSCPAKPSRSSSSESCR